MTAPTLTLTLPLTLTLGDRANRLVLDAYDQACQEASERGDAPDLRLRVEHFQIVNVSDIHRVHQPGETYGGGHACILASMQPTHATSDMVFAEKRLGGERLKGAYAWQVSKDYVIQHTGPVPIRTQYN